MPAAPLKPRPEVMVAEEEGDGELDLSRWETSVLKDRLHLPALKVPKELLRSFPHTKRVGPYLVGKMINKGSFAKVMEGLHIGTGEKVAIKVIDKKKARQDTYVLKNMKREPRIHQMIRHPHVVVLLETLETENSYYMAMELCSGGDLMDRICEKKRLEEKEVRRYTRQILSAVDHLHKLGIVHRDLKIENFLLDEQNNIKIVDFGLSNTLKPESLCLELLTTQCGSPAYAAPELLAHKKYGPKVDVWSIGVSMFAMLTGTLPFTVEPFNIKQLQQKMVDGEIGSFPGDVSRGAATFVLSLLEPDPEKRPSVKAVMEQKWINEGYTKRPLNTISRKNRLCPEEIDSSVLAYMTETMSYSLPEVIQTLTGNRPSAIMAAYHLLLAKLKRSQKFVKNTKKLNSSDWSLPGKSTWKDKVTHMEAKHQHQNDATNTKRHGRGPVKAQRTTDHSGSRRTNEQKKEEDDENRPPSPLLPPLQYCASPALPPLLRSPSPPAEDQDLAKASLFPDVFGDQVHLSPPKTSASQLCDSAPCQVLLLPSEPAREDGTPRPTRHLLRTTQSDGAANVEPTGLSEDNKPRHLGISERLEKLQTFYSSDRTDASPRRILEPDGDHLMEMTPPSAPLPRLRNIGLKNGRGRTWAGLGRPGAPGLLVNGAKPLAFSSQRQHTLIMKSLRQERGRRKDVTTAGAGERGTPGGGGKRNSIQLQSSLQGRVSDLNLPLLPAALQGKADRKNQIRGIDY